MVRGAYRVKMVDQVLARNLKKLAAEKNLRQVDIAAVCDRERKAAHYWINGQITPSAYELKCICLEYKISADELLGIKDEVDRWKS